MDSRIEKITLIDVYEGKTQTEILFRNLINSLPLTEDYKEVHLSLDSFTARYVFDNPDNDKNSHTLVIKLNETNTFSNDESFMHPSKIIETSTTFMIDVTKNMALHALVNHNDKWIRVQNLNSLNNFSLSFYTTELSLGNNEIIKVDKNFPFIISFRLKFISKKMSEIVTFTNKV